MKTDSKEILSLFKVTEVIKGSLDINLYLCDFKAWHFSVYDNAFLNSEALFSKLCALPMSSQYFATYKAGSWGKEKLKKKKNQKPNFPPS